MLNILTHGDPAAPKLLIAHGLFGSGRNWNVIAKRLSDQYFVVCPDMRNHGSSPRFDTHSYFDMADDLAELLDGPTYVVGHSMGGKAAMVLALRHPELVKRLIVADIAPVTYTHTQTQHINAMRGVDLNAIERRSDAGKNLDPEVRDFLLQSLDVKEKRWLLNLDTLEAEMPKILSIPDVSGTYDGPALFLSGADSDYVQPEHRPAIKNLFPNAHFAKLRDAGHWLHAQKPREFEAAVRAFCV
ncbi:alpha/beta fold hydrolase [Octadecabacter sp. 1_MG-2023]|uniref:alpha/beta fold hydrolase n=1 Tax=unclassified Octadecabacter TaxID=196158 RepID=UPI001C0A0D40|nr:MULTISPECIES: alpha/beta fold hydrolase [unclassified Octadecabacter]MBU2994710.1 alpha/beta fold hydrolase [Octadecabacter sp. B2R22]MDO6733996.1 alpha/beta fold hydrolase [Octadecabacter sp. 1_MG-2023]